MHTRIPELHGEDLTRSMGMFAVWWIEHSFVCMPAGGQFKGSGAASGKPAKLVSEKRIDRDRRQ